MTNTPEDEQTVQTIEFSDERQPGAMKASVDDSGASTAIMGLQIFGQADQTEIGRFQGDDDSAILSYQARQIQSGQTIVGIYGVKDEAKHFTSMGFILKESTS